MARRTMRLKLSKRNKQNNPSPIRASKEMMSKINHVKAVFIMNGMNPPTTAKATQILSRLITKEAISHALLK